MPSRDWDTPVLPRLLCPWERTACPAPSCPAGSSSRECASPTCTWWGVSCGQTGSAVISSTLGLGVVSRTERELLSQSSPSHSTHVQFCFCVFNCPVSALRENLDAWIFWWGGEFTPLFSYSTTIRGQPHCGRRVREDSCFGVVSTIRTTVCNAGHR